MQEFINIFGQTNILIVFGIIVVIIIALLVILIIEKHSVKKYQKEFEKYDKLKKEKKQEDKLENQIVVDNLEEKAPVENKNIQNDVVYVTNEKTQEEAKKAIEEAAKKLVYEDTPDIISPTFFERMQEENSIISYDELISSNIDIDKENERILQDEGNEPITIDELYSFKEENSIEKVEKEELKNDSSTKNLKQVAIKSLDEDNLVDENNDDITYYTSDESKKFKNSDVISPIFGVKRDVIIKKEYNELGETIDIKELDLEIKKTEEFLKELKKLKNKLD